MSRMKYVLSCVALWLSITTAFATPTKIHTLAKDHAFVFFFASTCGHCHHLAPTLQSVAKEYGFHIFDFSFDSKPIPGFDHPGVVTKTIFDTY